MRKLLLFIGFSVVALSVSVVNAQSFFLTTLDTSSTRSTLETFESYTNVVNNTDSVLSMKWVIEEESVDPMWTRSICGPDNCTPPGTMSGEFGLVGKESKLVNVHLSTNDYYGSGLIKIRFFEIGKEDSAVTYTIFAEAKLDSILGVQSDIFRPKLQYNQFNHEIKVQEALSNFELSVFNLEGKRMLKGNNAYQLKLTGLKHGVYIVRLVANNSNQVFVRKIQVL